MTSEQAISLKQGPFAIVGMGLTGESVMKLLLECHIPRNSIATFDSKKPADFSDPQKLMDTFKPQTLIVSPGVPLNQIWIQEAVKFGTIVTSELELASRFLTTEFIICITGSVGKSTTAALVNEGARAQDPYSFLGGNFGIPLADYSFNIIRGKPKARYLVLEISSFQLENYKNLKSNFSIITFLGENHLERYRDKEHYYQTKLSLLEKTSDNIVLNINGGDLIKYKSQIQSQYPDKNISWVDRNYLYQKNLPQPRLLGFHNHDNLAMSLCLADQLRWGSDSIQAMLDFGGLSHRLENCGLHQGILFLNDSKATSIDSIFEATKSIESNTEFDQRIHLFIGGRDKNLPWEKLNYLNKNQRYKFHFFGEAGDIARNKSQLKGDYQKTLKASLESVKNFLKSGEIVLLSPGGTSFDEFKSFEDRGNFFKKWIESEFNDNG